MEGFTLNTGAQNNNAPKYEIKTVFDAVHMRKIPGQEKRLPNRIGRVIEKTYKDTGNKTYALKLDNIPVGAGFDGWVELYPFTERENR